MISSPVVDLSTARSEFIELLSTTLPRNLASKTVLLAVPLRGQYRSANLLAVVRWILNTGCIVYL
jgi:hypothetical protein